MSNESDREPSPPHTSLRRALLGVFILFQVVFLIVANLLGFFKWLPDQLKDKRKALVDQAAPGLVNEDSHVSKWTDQVQTNINSWTQLTGQEQNWMLYTPVSRTTGFPAVVLLWDDIIWEPPFIKGTVFAYDEKNGMHLCASWNPSARRDLPLPVLCDLGILGASDGWEAFFLTAAAKERPEDKPSRIEFLQSENEPKDLSNFIRFGNCRLRRYEGQFYLNLKPEKGEAADVYARRITERVSTFTSTWREPALAYMKWRLRDWQRANPDQPVPRQVMLFQRFYRMRDPEEVPRGWDGPILFPIARWQPFPDDLDALRSLEPFDYKEQRFLPGL